MATKESLTASIGAVGDEIRALKAAKAPGDQVMPKVAELKSLKEQYQAVVGEPFDAPPAPKKEKKAAAAEAPKRDGPSKNELKKAAKAVGKDARRAEHKAGAEALPLAPPAASVASPGVPAKTKIHRSITATMDMSADPSAALIGAVLHASASTGLVSACALAMCPGQLAGVTVQGAANTELPRLVLPGGASQVVGDHTIARLVIACAGVGLSAEGRASPVAGAKQDQWLDLANMYCADEAPLLTLLEAGLSSSASGFLSGASGPGLADVAMVACLSAPGAPKRLNVKAFPAAAKWLASAQQAALIKDGKAILAGKAPVGAAVAAGDGGGGAEKTEKPKGEDVGGCPPLEGAVEGQVVTRFPPEPSGFLHIGHAKAVLLNEYYARRYKGKLLVRFDDTNPSKEKAEFEENILRDLASLGVKPDAISHSSDHFDACQIYARKLIADGHAFMDDTEQEAMQAERRDRVESKRRGQSPAEALKWFEKMLAGTAPEWCLRAKIDMSSDNGTLRDPVLYRHNATPHHKTGTKYHAYPTYDMVCPIVDSLEGVTHALRTLEYADRDAQYFRLQELMGLRPVRIYAFSKLNFVYTVLSKRKLQWFVDNGKVPTWNDPRFPTVQGCVRRGVTMTALRRFIYAQGASRNVVLQEWDKFWAMNKDEFEQTAPRYMGVAAGGAVELKVSGADADALATADVAAITVQLVPSDPASAPRPMRVASSVLLEAEDAATCSVGDKVILLMWGVVEVTAVVKDAEGKVVGLSAVRLPDASVKKIKQKFNWVAKTADALAATVTEYDHLIAKPKLEEGDKIEDFVNPLSVGQMPVLVEPALASAAVGDIVQLVRRGFFRVDADAASPGGLNLVLIPDGKAKAMSSLSTALPHH